MTKSILLIAAASMLAAASTQAQEAAAPASPLTANVAVTSNYKFRGQDQGNVSPSRGLSPAIQGGFDYTKDGFYIGNWNSSIGWISESGTNAHIEMDFYGGYKGEIIKDLAYDVGILQYYYPHGTRFDVTELYGALTYSYYTLKYSGTVSKDYFGYGYGLQKASPTPIDRPRGRGTSYVDFTANVPVIDKVTFNGHLGYTRYATGLRDGGIPGYWDYKLGATYDLGSGFAAAAGIVGANKQGFYGDINKARFIASISKSM